MELQTEWDSGKKLLEIKPTSCRVAVMWVLQGYSILLGVAGSRTQPSPSFRGGKDDENKLKRRQKRTAGEKKKTLGSPVPEQEFNLSKLEKQQQEMGKCVFTAKHIKIVIKETATSSSPRLLGGAHEAVGFICNKYPEHIFRLKHCM